jgi:hypothetical protein
VSYLISSMCLLRCQLDSAVQANMLAVQRSVIEYMSAGTHPHTHAHTHTHAVALQSLGTVAAHPLGFHPGQGQGQAFRPQHSTEMRYASSPALPAGAAPFEPFVGPRVPGGGGGYPGGGYPLNKTTEDIDIADGPHASRAFLPPAPASPGQGQGQGLRPPLPKAPAPSTLLHTLHQEREPRSGSGVSNDSDFDRVGYSLTRRHSLSGEGQRGGDMQPTPPRLLAVATAAAPPYSTQALPQAQPLGEGKLSSPRLGSHAPAPVPAAKARPAAYRGPGANPKDPSIPKQQQQQQQQRAAAEMDGVIFRSVYVCGEYAGMGPPSASPLSREIEHFVRCLDSYSESVHQQKLDVLRRIRGCVENLWPRAQAKPFGSFVTGISLPRSDLDVVICLPKVRKEAEPNAPGVLEGRNAIKETWQQKLTQGLMREDWVDTASIRVIPNTAVPVLKLQAKPVACADGTPVVFSLDVSFEGPGHRGLDANKLILSILRRYPALRPIVLVLKCFLSRRGLCEAFTGGLSSYVLVLMVARFLQEQASVCDVGALLLGVLDFYGNRLDPRATGISFTRACYFSRAMSIVTAPGPGPVPAPPPDPARRAPFVHAPSLSRHSLAEAYALSSSLRLDAVMGGGGGGFSSAPMSPAGPGPIDNLPLNAPYFGASYSEDYIGYVHSSPGVYSHHPGGSVMLSADRRAPLPHMPLHTAADSLNTGHSAHQQPPLFYKFDPFFLEDPLSPGNNVGRNCFRIYQVQRSWSEAVGAISLRVQRLEEMYYDIYENSGGKQHSTNSGGGVAKPAPAGAPAGVGAGAVGAALQEASPADLSLLKVLVGDTTSYRPY